MTVKVRSGPSHAVVGATLLAHLIHGFGRSAERSGHSEGRSQRLGMESPAGLEMFI